MAEEKTEKKEDLKKQLDSIAYELRQLHDKVERHSRNWVKAANTIMGDVGGKPGEAKHGKSIISVLIATAVTLLLAGSVFATIPLLDLTTDDGANNGTFTVISDEAGTATLTVDNVTAGNLTTSTQAIDINSVASNDYIRLDQTNATGVPSAPYMAITDARTGTYANEAAEATLVITPSGSYAISVASGISAFAGDIAANGNITGDDATIITNISIIAVDTIMSDGASLTLGDGTETIAINSSLTDLSALGAFTGVLSVTLTNGASIVAVNGTTLRLTEATIDLVGNTTVDTITVADKLNITVNATSVTNNHILTVADSYYVLNGVGQADNVTNTLVLANPAIIGDIVTFTVKSDSTNLITLADSGNVNLAGAWLGDNFDTITLIAQEAAEWTEVSRSNN